MFRQKLKALGGGFLLSMGLAVATVTPSYGDDIDIYLQPPPDTSALPLVVLGLDLNVDPLQIVCSNILADPSTLVGEPLCAALQQAAALPVLEQALGLQIGSLADTLLGGNNVTGGLLGLVNSLTGISLTQLADKLRGITGATGSGTTVALNQLDVVRLLLYRIVHQLVGVRLAIIVNNANTCTADQFTVPRHNTKHCSNGAFFLLGATELLESNLNDTVDEVLARLGQINLNALEPGADPTPPYQGKEVYYELVRYLSDGRIYNANINADNGLPVAADPDIAPGNRGVDYISPLDGDTCQTITMVNLLLTDSQLDNDSDADILADPIFAGANADGGDFTWREMTDFLAATGFDYRGANYKIKSLYLVNGGDTGGVGGLLSNLTGTVSNLPIGLNPLALPFATKQNFQPVNVASASFGGPQPVFSRDNLSQAGDNLYYGMFKPDPDRKPAWRGNLKKLTLAELNGNLSVVDAQNLPAIGPDGNLRASALTFWTDSNGLTNAGDDEVNGRDGKSIDRGGAGSFLIAPRTQPTKTNPNASGSGSDQGSPAGPRIFYEKAGAAGALQIAPLELNDTTVDEADPALAGDRREAAELIAYARGYETDPNVLGDSGYGGLLGFLNNAVSGINTLIKNLLKDTLSGLFCNNILGFLGIILGVNCPVPSAQTPPPQAWLMGDILHSDPLAIDYGDDIRIFTGSNRGFLHEFRDQPLAGESSSFGGQEVWRVAPRAMLAKFNQWRSGQPTAASRPYGVDGAPVAWIKDTDGNIDVSQGDHVYLYFGLRRGGKAYYGLDVSDPDAQPTGLWSISSANSDFAEMGLTFSTPRVGKIRTQGANNTPGERTVLIFGGGYNSAKDAARGSDSKVGKNDTEGNAIYVVDATSGALIWKARGGSIQGSATVNGKPVWTAPAMTDGIASEVTTLDTTGDGFVDRLYVGDTGGRVWRVDMSDADPAQWKAAAIANLGRHGSNNVANDRRFFERPDVVHIAKHNQSFYALVIGSGNRADPLNRNTNNYLYVIKDSGAVDTSTTPITQSDLTDFSENCASADNCLNLLDTTNVPSGWKIRLGPAADTNRAGEKAFSSPITIAGKVFFTSYVPPSVTANACRPQEGTGRIYAIDLLDASGVLALFAQDGEPGDSVSKDYARGTTMTAAGIPAGLTYIGPQTLLGSDFSVINIAHKTMFRTYWHERDGEH